MDPIQSLLQTLEDFEDTPMRTALRSLLTSVSRGQVSAQNGPRTGSLLGEDAGDGVFPLEFVFEERYELGEVIGTGAMGTVYRSLDLRLQRTVALKVLHEDFVTRQSALSRFLREARVTGCLQHPGIVAIHDVGVLADGRPFYAMREVRGDALLDRIAEQPAVGPHLRHLIGVLLSAASAVAFAHAQGVVHRDLKPENIMVGRFGDVAVVDWGLAHTLDEDWINDSPTNLDVAGYQTVTGQLAGTPSYMPPEQARGEPVGKAADVYALGASLWQVLMGTAPFPEQTAVQIVRSLQADRVPGPPSHGPAELVELCCWAMHARPECRPEDAEQFASALRDWLEGRRRHAQAEGEVRRAKASLAEAGSLRKQAEGLCAQLTKLELSSAALRQERWTVQDKLERVSSMARLLEVTAAQHAQLALAHRPDDREARALLADYYAARHREDEGAGRTAEAAQWELFLRSYDDGRYRRYLRGFGRFSLCLDRPASVHLHRVILRKRRMVLEPVESWTGDAVEHELPIGSYIAEITGTGPTVRYPIHIGRERHWDGVPAQSDTIRKLRVPGPGELGPEERLVPGGWFQAGGDVLAANSEPAARRWVGDFVMRVHPVTNVEYLAFLNDLVVRDLKHRAERYAPLPGPSGKSAYLFEPSARLRTMPGEMWRSDSPVLNVTYEAASAFAAWVAENTGQWWRLPSEDEWEKAARGVDARCFPMGPELRAVQVNCDRPRAWPCRSSTTSRMRAPTASTAWRATRERGVVRDVRSPARVVFRSAGVGLLPKGRARAVRPGTPLRRARCVRTWAFGWYGRSDRAS